MVCTIILMHFAVMLLYLIVKIKLLLFNCYILIFQVRLQTQDSNNKIYRGTYHCISTIIKQESVSTIHFII